MGSEWHTSADAIKNDAIRRNELLAAGYIPFEIFKDQFADIDYMDGLMRSVREAAGLPARRIGRARAKKERSAREELWARLSSVDVRAWTSRENFDNAKRNGRAGGRCLIRSSREGGRVGNPARKTGRVGKALTGIPDHR